MQIARYRPWGDLTTLGDEMNRLFGGFFDREAAPRLLSHDFSPALDIAETKDSILVKMEIPGLDPSDLDISIKDGVLTIKGEKKAEKEEKGKDFHRVERAYGSFCRTIALSSDVDAEKTKATYEKGVLEIDLLKKEESKQREIHVQVK